MCFKSGEVLIPAQHSGDYDTARVLRFLVSSILMTEILMCRVFAPRILELDDYQHAVKRAAMEKGMLSDRPM